MIAQYLYKMIGEYWYFSMIIVNHNYFVIMCIKKYFFIIEPKYHSGLQSLREV